MFTTQNISIIIAVLIAVIIIALLGLRNKSKSRKKQQPSIIKGLSAFIDNDYTTALDELRAIAQADSNQTDVFLTIGLIYKKSGDYTKAAQVFEVMLFNKDIDAQYKSYLKTELAKNYLLANIPVKALATLQDSNNSNAQNIHILAYANYMIGNIDNALAFANKYKKVTGSTISGFYAKCMIAKAIEVNDYSKSIKYLKQALSESPKCRAARFMMANLHANNGKNAKAIDEYKKIITEDLIRDTKDIETIRHEFIAAGNETELYDVYLNASYSNASSPLIHIALAKTLIDNSDTEAAIRLLGNFLEQESQNPIVLKEYAKLTNNKIMLHLATKLESYKCLVCKDSHENYSDECCKCNSFDTISTNK